MFCTIMYVFPKPMFVLQNITSVFNGCPCQMTQIGVNTQFRARITDCRKQLPTCCLLLYSAPTTKCRIARSRMWSVVVGSAAPRNGQHSSYAMAPCPYNSAALLRSAATVWWVAYDIIWITNCVILYLLPKYSFRTFDIETLRLRQKSIPTQFYTAQQYLNNSVPVRSAFFVCILFKET